MAFEGPRINTVPEYQSSHGSPTGAEGLSLIGRPHVLVVGASGRFIARSALRAGYAVSVVDLFGDADTAAICDQSSAFSSSGQRPTAVRCESLQEFALRLVGSEKRDVESASRSVAEIPAGATVVVLAGGGENYPELFESQHYPHAVVTGPAPVSIRRLLDLDCVVDCCLRNNIAMPPTVTSASQSTDDAVMWLRKKAGSGGGLQVRPWDGKSSVDFESGFYLQQRFAGATISGCYVAAVSTGTSTSRLLGVCAGRDRQSESDFRYTGSYGPIVVERTRREEMERVGSVIAKCFNLRGVFGIDFVDSPQGVVLIDINPRITASAELVERFCRARGPDFSIVETHLRACLGNELPPQIVCYGIDGNEGDDQNNNGGWFSKRIIYHKGSEPLVVSIEISNRLSVIDGITDIPSPGTIVQPGAPVVTVHGHGHDRPTMEAKTMAALKVLGENFGVEFR